MSLKVIELNDNAINVGDESGLILESLGFALALENKIELGESAEQQARLQPTNSYNKFWHELSMEPLSRHRGVRHLADLAYAQLMHLAELGDIDSDVIFAVPGNFTRQQLAILLGLAKQSPFNPVGLVDSALAGALNTASSESVVYADIQLHQVVLSKLLREGNTLKTESVIQVPGVGSQNFMNLMMELATGLFIQQCRFNPQHNAESEQQLYNALPHWLQQDENDDNSLILELRSHSNVHTAKMPRESLRSNLAQYYEKISEQLLALTIQQDSQLILSKGMNDLPGFVSSISELGDIQVLSRDAVNSACIAYQHHIIRPADEIHLINALTIEGSDSASSNAREPQPDQKLNPTHVLFCNRAVPIASLDIINADKLNGDSAPLSSLVVSARDKPRQLGLIELASDGVFLDSSSEIFLLNEKPVTGRQKLKLGDNLRVHESSDELRLIQVSDGE
jgi:hypothetical protein